MQDSDKDSSARPRMTIEATARTVSSPQPETGPEKAASEQADVGPERAADAGDESRRAEPPPSQAAVPPRGFPTSFLVTGLIAAVIAVAVVFATLAAMRFASEPTRRALATLVGAEAPRQAAARIDQEVSGIAAAVADLEAAIATLSDTQDRLDALDGRLAAFDSGLKQLAEADAGASAERVDAAAVREEIATRLERAEARLSALDAAGVAATAAVEGLRHDLAEAAETGASAAAVAARLAREAARIDSLAGRVSGIEQTSSMANGAAEAAREQASRIAARLDALDERVAGLETGSADRGKQVADALSARIAALEGRASELDAGLAAARAPVAAIAHTLLAQKAAAGEPFARELAILKAELGPQDAISELAPLAARPVPTLAELTAAAAALPARPQTGGEPAAPPPDGLVTRLLDRAGEAVSVRRVGEQSATVAPETVVERLEAGDLAGAIEAAGALPPNPDRERWIADARARQALDAAVATLGALLESRQSAGGKG